MRVVVIGSGGSAESAQRACSSYLIDDEVLIDVGPGSFRNLVRYFSGPLKLKYIAITHLHGDHIFDIGALLWGMALAGRTEEITIAGPRGVKNAVNTMLAAGMTPPDLLKFGIRFVEVKPGEEIKFGRFNIKTAAGKHTIEDIAYRINDACFSGDTSPSDELIKLFNRCELLIHESSGISEMEPFLAKFGHSSARQAAMVAASAKAERLVLSHIPPALSSSTRRLLAEARQVFKGALIAKDFMEITI